MTKVLTDILTQNARRFGRRPAVLKRLGYRTVSFTYQEVLDLARSIAIFLARQGVQPGDKVLMVAPNSPYWVCVFWGCLLRGAVVVPLNTQSPPELIKKIARQTQAKILFNYSHFKYALPPELKIYNTEFIDAEVAHLPARGFKPTPARPDDAVQILYTSGTTGDPKGVVLTHRNLLSNLTAVSGLIPIGPGDTFLSILPLSHIFEQLAGFLLPFANGARIVYSRSPSDIGGLLKEYRVTHLVAVPEFLRLMMDKIESKAKPVKSIGLWGALGAISRAVGYQPLQRLLFAPVLHQLGGRLHTVASGGAPLDPALERKWNALGIRLLQGYGLTETSPIVTLNTHKSHHVGSVGKVMSEVKAKTAPDGEILVRGPNIFSGYYRDTQKTRAAFTSDGWFKTGDIGSFDRNGFLYLRGRKKYMIKGPGAENIYPEDIEMELNRQPEIKDSCVIGLEKPSGHVEIHAVLLPRQRQGWGKPKQEQTIELANQRLAAYQRINRWSIWPEDDFPRSATRKVKRELVEASLKNQKPLVANPHSASPLHLILAEVTRQPSAAMTPATKIVRELHLDSLLRLELVSRIEEKFGVAVEEAAITPATTIADLERLIATAKPRELRFSLTHWPRTWWAVGLRQLLWTLVVFPIGRLFIKLRVEGAEQLQNLSLPVVFMPNHLTLYDALAVGLALPPKLRRRISFAAAQDITYERYHYLAWLTELAFNSFPLPRHIDENIRSGFESMGRVLDQNWSVVVFPEGELSRTGKLQPLKRGAGIIAVKMNAPIIPMKISGMDQILPRGGVIPRRSAKVTVRFGQPVRFDKRESYITATKKIQKLMAEL